MIPGALLSPGAWIGVRRVASLHMEDAPTERVLGVDFNGYHALAGLLLFAPAFYFALRPKWALYYAIYAAGALFLTGIWALFDEQPAWVFTFPNNTSDAIFHLATGALFAIVALVQLRRDSAEF